MIDEPPLEAGAFQDIVKELLVAASRTGAEG